MALPSFVIPIIAVISIAFVALLGFLGWAFLFRRRKQFPFLLYSRDCKRRRVIFAKLKIDPENRENKRFFFPGIDSSLELREPTCFHEGKAYREIMQNKNGGYSYIDGAKIDEDGFIKLSLSPDEKVLALSRMKDYGERYANPMSKHQAYMLITGFVLIIILVVGIVYSTISYVGAGKNLIKFAEQNKEAQRITASAAANLEKVNEQQIAILSVLTSDKVNITRRVT